MLSNAYFLANFRFDSAENEPAKNLQNLHFFQLFENFANLANSILLQAGHHDDHRTRIGEAHARGLTLEERLDQAPAG